LDTLINQDFGVDNLDQTFYDYLAGRLNKVVGEHANDYICVVTGFFGPCPGSLLTSIGRGYTDLTAALVAVGVNASELQIWKEVDGIFTADPRKVKNARLLAKISPQEAAELTYYGSEVIHPFTMEQVMRSNIPIRIKNTFSPNGDGTLITLMSQSPADLRVKLPTAVTVKDNISVLNIHSNRKTVSHGFLAKIFLILDKFGIVSDLIACSEVHVSIAFGSESKFTNAVSELKKIATVEVVDQQAILSLVGKHMKNMVGISAKLFGVLASNGINIEMISQGASEINISCVIKESEAQKALVLVHDQILGIKA
jgi:aspartate kinase